MKVALANFLSSGRTSWLVLGGLTVAGLSAWGIRAYRNSRPSPAEIERRRREALNSGGKMGDANLLEFRDEVVLYSYYVAGVEYTAAQDLSDLQMHLPADCWAAIGPACVKYDPRIPANSMVLCEDWSGLRTPARRVE
jgi:hypothetical protein